MFFYCSSKYQGKSLNDRCLQGPDLLNRLLHILLRFRQHRYAIQADVEAMYNQVRIPDEDKDALRFLWYEGQDLKHYRMTSHLFEGVRYASSSTYALQNTVKKCDDRCSPIVRDTVMNSFYVDDCLRSSATKEEAREILHGTTEVLQVGGFTLTKFIVNKIELLEEVPVEHRAK